LKINFYLRLAFQILIINVLKMNCLDFLKLWTQGWWLNLLKWTLLWLDTLEWNFDSWPLSLNFHFELKMFLFKNLSTMTLCSKVNCLGEWGWLKARYKKKGFSLFFCMCSLIIMDASSLYTYYNINFVFKSKWNNSFKAIWYHST